jgi:PIN domain nuclease of toxin-antitoxin system
LDEGNQQNLKLDNYSLDTHSLVWYIRGSNTLSSKARQIIQEIFDNKAGCYVSTMAILEAYNISLKYKDFIFSNFLKIINRPNIKIISFDQKVLDQSIQLPNEIDIHDRIITATAIVTSSPLVTKDRVLRRNFPLETIW